MSKYAAFFLFLFTLGCAHQSKKVAEINFPFSQELLKDVQYSGRLPASLPAIENNFSTRRLYFSVLYQQLKVLSTHIGTSVEIKTCPQFHTERINSESKTPVNFLFHQFKNYPTQSSFFPEQVFQGNFSLTDYQQTIHSEVLTLCEEGVSENFYKFDNLMSYHASRGEFHRAGATAMEALLKIPIFANFYLFRMIQSKANPYPYNLDEHNLIKLTQFHWFEDYVREAREVRESLLNTRTVQR